jgi:hypothetical protein
MCLVFLGPVFSSENKSVNFGFFKVDKIEEFNLRKTLIILTKSFSFKRDNK